MTRLGWIEIENFRGISHLRYEPKQINLLIGRNNSGKTSILNAVYSNLTGRFEDSSRGYEGFYRMYDVKLGTSVAKITSNQHSLILYGTGTPLPADIAALVSSRYSAAMEMTYDELNLSKDTLEGFYAYLKDTFPISVSVHDGSVSVLIDPLDTRLSDTNVREKYREWTHKVISSQVIPRGKQEPQYYNYYGMKYYDIVPHIVHFINLGISSAVPKNIVRVEDLNKVIGKYFEEGVELRELEEIAKEYRIVPHLDRLTAQGVYYKDEAGKITYLPYMLHGSGFFTLLMLLSKMKMAKDGILLIEEPENNLHPGYLSVFVEQVMVLAKKLNVQVFMTTHSYDLIEELASYPETEEEREMIQISRIVNRKGMHELYNYSSERALEEMVEFKMDLRGT